MKLASFKTAQGASYGAVTSKGIVDLRRYLGMLAAKDLAPVMGD